MLYGRPPTSPIAYVQGKSLVDTVDRSLEAREATIRLLKFHLERSHHRMKAIADAKRTNRTFDVG